MPRAAFRRWQSRWTDDPSLHEDLRVAAPVFFDQERNTVRICATVGVQTRKLTFDFVERPEVSVRREDAAPSASDEPYFRSAERMILAPITLECDVREPPTRAELRAICDRHSTVSAIRAALEARGE